MHRLKAYLFLVVLLVAAPWPVAALTISPTRLEIDPQMTKPHRLEISVTGSTARYVELSLMKRIAGDGSFVERVVPAPTDAFIIRPTQVLVPPGGTRSITIQWTGGRQEGSASYYLIVEELPISVDPSHSGQDVLLLARFYVPLHVSTSERPQVSFHRQPREGHYALVNDGKAYQRLADLRFQVVTDVNTPGSLPRSLPGVVLARVAQVDALLPGGRIEFSREDLGLAENQSIIGVVLP
jgi:P pilus assembly chaperone PapD